MLKYICTEFCDGGPIHTFCRRSALQSTGRLLTAEPAVRWSSERSELLAGVALLKLSRLVGMVALQPAIAPPLLLAIDKLKTSSLLLCPIPV